MKLYEYAIIYRPTTTKEQQDKGEKAQPVLLMDVTRILANSEQEAQMIAARAIPETHIDKLDRVEIALRPF